MELSEIYFHEIMIISGLLNLPIVLFSEDLKDKKRFKKYIKITFFIGLIGVIMVLTNWNYYCSFQCLVITFSPFITLLVSKTVMILSKKVIKKEGFQVNRISQFNGSSKIELSDGIYQKNNGDLKHEAYYSRYTFFIAAIPVIFLVLLLILVKEITC